MSSFWLALVEIRALKKDTLIGDAYGAYVNVAYKAFSKEEFIEQIHSTFKEENFDVSQIEDIESNTEMTIENPDNAEKLSLLDDLIEGYSYSWGVFHSFDEEE